MPVYPVSYRSAAAVLRGGFQIIPKLPPAPLPVIAFLLAFELAWRALDMWDRGSPFWKDLWDTEKVDEVLPSVENELTYPLQDVVDYDHEWLEYKALPKGFTKTQQCTVPTYLQQLQFAGFANADGTCFVGYIPTTTPYALDTWNVVTSWRYITGGSGYKYKDEKWVNSLYLQGTGQQVDPRGKNLPGVIPADVFAPKVPLDRAFPTAWSLPIKGSGEVRNPPFPIPGVVPRPVPPGVIPGVTPLPVPGVVPGVGVGAGVGTGEVAVPTPFPIVLVPIGGSVAAFPAEPLGRNHFPPSKGKAEVKMKGKAAKGIRWMANFLTESKDFIEALWKALPKEMRSKCKGPRGGKAKCTVQQMLADLYKARDYMFNNEDYVKRAVIEVIVNEIGDNFYGRVGQKYKAAGEKLRELGYWNDRPAGWQTGDRYRPRPKTPGAHTDYVHDFVENAVNWIW